MAFKTYKTRLTDEFRKEFPVASAETISRMVDVANRIEHDDFSSVPPGTLADVKGSRYIRTDYQGDTDDVESWTQVTGVQYWSGVGALSHDEMKEQEAVIIGHVEIGG